MDKQEFNIKSKTHTLRGVIENFATSKNVVILIHGSGNSDRDASVTYKGKLISQNFKLLAKYLTNSGLAVCRYDKRENAEIKQLKEADLNVIVTDHHEIETSNDGEWAKQVLPEANAVINPKRIDQDYPFTDLCGAAVCFKLMSALFKRLDGDYELSLIHI